MGMQVFIRFVWNNARANEKKFHDTYERDGGHQYVSEQAKISAAWLPLAFQNLVELLTRYRDPNTFSQKMQITRSQFLLQIGLNPYEMKREFIGNMCLAIWRLEQSRDKFAWVNGDLQHSIRKFVIYRVASFAIKGELRDGQIKCMMACDVFVQNPEFRRLFGLQNGEYTHELSLNLLWM